LLLRAWSIGRPVVAIRRLAYLRPVQRLAAADYRNILEFLYRAGEVEGTDPFPEPLLAELRRLVPCDVLSYGGYDPEGPQFRGCGVRIAGEPLAPLTPEIVEALRRFRHQYPHPPRMSQLMPTLRWSDRLPPRTMHKLAIYHHVGRPLRIEYSISVWLHDRVGRPVGYLAFDRLKPDFTDRDLLLLETLQPHLRQLVHNAAQRLPAAVDGLTPREHQIVTLVAHGRKNHEIATLLYIAPGTVHKHLDNIYAKLGAHNRAEAVARLRTDSHSD
jgi:DNA-binding CsgD family transcriptional regulator